MFHRSSSKYKIYRTHHKIDVYFKCQNIKSKHDQFLTLCFSEGQLSIKVVKNIHKMVHISGEKTENQQHLEQTVFLHVTPADVLGQSWKTNPKNFENTDFLNCSGPDTKAIFKLQRSCNLPKKLCQKTLKGASATTTLIRTHYQAMRS